MFIFETGIEQGCVFPHPDPKIFRETAIFSFSNFFPLFPLIRGEKHVILGRDKKKSSPGSPCTTLSTSIRLVQAFGQSFSVIFTLHSSCSSLYRITELLSRIKHRSRGIFYHDRYSVVDHFFQQKKTPTLSLTLTNLSLIHI